MPAILNNPAEGRKAKLECERLEDTSQVGMILLVLKLKDLLSTT